LESGSVETETAIPEITAVPEVSSLNPDEKRKLVLLWAKQPNGSLDTLVKKFNQQIDRAVPDKIIKQELVKMGLITVSKSKRL
jgi:hypothetical protein